MNNIRAKLCLICLLAISFNASWAEEVVEDAVEAPPKINCTLTDKLSGDNALAEKDTFHPDTAMIYFVCISADVKIGQHIKAVWVAADTNDVAPANYSISEKSIDVTEKADNEHEWAVKYSLSKPTASWPIGHYHVDLYLDNKLLQSTKFNIKASVS